VEDVGWQWRGVALAVVLLMLLGLLGCQALSAKPAASTSQPGQLSSTSSTLMFGTVPLGGSQPGSAQVTNTGGSSVTISQATVTGATFSLSRPSFPLTVAPGESTTLNLTFTPVATGTATGNVTLASNAANPTLTLSLSGNGVAAGQLTATPVSLDFGSVLVGSSQSLTGIVSNTGGSSLTISQASISGPGFSLTGLTLPLTLAAGQSASFSIIFTAQASGSVAGSVTLVSNGANPTVNLPLSAIGLVPGSLVANPASASFGSVQIGNSKAVAETLTNSGGAAVTISKATATGTGFALSGLNLPLTLNAGQSTTFTVQFGPQSAGSSTGSFAIVSNANNPTLAVPASGIGVTPGKITASPSSQTFGTVQVGNNKSLSQTLTNSGGSSLTISQASVTGSGFSLSGLTLPLTLKAGQSTNVTLKFVPASAGIVSGSLSITSNGSNPSFSVPLTGTGVLPPGTLSPNPATLGFGSVQTGSSKSVTETLTNSGGSSLTISQANVTGTGMSVAGLTLPMTLNAGQSISFNVLFSPQSSGSVSGNLGLTSNASNSTLNISLSGTGVAPGLVAANPTSQSFGNVATGSTKTLSQTLTNSGGSALTISQITPGGSGFSFSGINPPVTLNAGQSYTFNVTFTPTAGGSANGTLAVASNGSNPNLSVSLSGTGVAPGQLGVGPSSINFGNVTVGSSSVQSGTVTASGASVTVASASINSTEFALSGISLPITLAAGNSASFTVTFRPQSTGTASTNLTFTSNASNAPTVQSLTGNGTAPVQHSVALSWNASTSINVVGYNIYRGSVSGGTYTQINSALNSTTTATDSTVVSGQTYYYVVTAVDSSAAESSYSNEVQAVIP
jgi:centrosomal CEP192-like protein/HYDIN/CFA65/VesB family protein/ASPM-SPD-2-Hydin domain-containing protein